MKTKEEKWQKYLAAGAFLLALIINVKVTLDDPFVLINDISIAQTTTGTTTDTSGNYGDGWLVNSTTSNFTVFQNYAISESAVINGITYS